jgi:small subunit ribosomal protein S25e
MPPKKAAILASASKTSKKKKWSKGKVKDKVSIEE